MKRILINGLVTGIFTGSLAACGGGSTDVSSDQLLATTTVCYAAWSSATAYNGGALVSYAGINYKANWWTQGENPSTNNGGTGSGKPWTSQGVCGGAATTTTKPTATTTTTKATTTTTSSGSTLVAALPNSAQYNPVCTPTVVIDLQDPNGFTAFTSRASLNDLKIAVQQLARNDCSVLYKSTSEPQNHPTTFTLVIKAMSGVAYTAGNTTTLSSTYIQGQSDAVKETLGVLAHEIAHVYQYNDSDTAHVDGFGGIIEGMADYVRYRDGYKTLAANRHRGGTWKDGYDTTAFFIDWLNRTYPDFAYTLNQSLSSKDGKQWTTNFFVVQTGQSVDTLWSRYQQSLP